MEKCKTTMCLVGLAQAHKNSLKVFYLPTDAQ
jgi:hypothetical protein